jgi:hypothetical protein
MRLALAAATCAPLVAPRGARAQQVHAFDPTIGPPRVVVMKTPGDASGGSSDPRVPSYVLDPIRMALWGTAVPRPRGEPTCGGSEEFEESGLIEIGPRGPALRRVSNIQLIPRLTLSGFSRGGCASDTGVGGALVYAIPISSNVFLAASLGVLHLPHAGPNASSVTNVDARLDLHVRRPGGHSYAVGIGTRGLTFGGAL